jgi:AraC-like DNA-binding protein
VISKMVNQGFGMNFNDFVNDYRVKAVIEQFKKGIHQRQTLLAICFDCGFNSKTTFNRCFKKQTGMSPKTFLEQLNK